MANKVLQLLRNDVFFNSREEAIAGLKTKLATLKGGEPAIAIYIEGGANKLVLGISAGNGQYTIFDPNAVNEQKEIFEKQVRDAGKPENMVAKIVEGKMNSWYSESVLIDQKLFTDNKISIKSLIDEISKEAGATASIKNFAIISLGV